MCDFNSEIKMIDTQGKLESREALLSISTSEEETMTRTPRSASNSYNDSAVETPRSMSKSEDASTYDDDAEDEDVEGDEEGDYYAFLRELAGSFEQDEDSESESGSEDEAEGEEGQTPIGNRSRAASACATDCRRPAAPPRPAACGWARPGGSATIRGEQGKDEAEKESSHIVLGSVERAPTAGRPCPPAVSVGSSGSSSAAGGCESTDGAHVRRNWCPTPSRDNRGPVEDDYDVVQATRDYTFQRPGDRAQQKREDLREAISILRVQAQTLLRPAGNPHSGPDIRAHYARVRSELLAQAQALETELASLDQAPAPELTGCAGESIKTYGSRDMMASAGMQELLLGSQC